MKNISHDSAMKNVSHDQDGYEIYFLLYTTKKALFIHSLTACIIIILKTDKRLMTCLLVFYIPRGS